MNGAPGNSPSSAATAAASSSRFDSLEQTLEVFVENARHLCVIVSDFGASSSGQSSSTSSGLPPSTVIGGGSGGNAQGVLNQKLQTLVCGLQELDHVKHHFQDVKIPVELFDQYIDKGRNPQLYTKECMERTLSKNKQVNGKIELYKKFRANLLKELSEEFPKDTMQYRAIREQATSVPAASLVNSNGNAAVKHENEPR